MRRFLLTVLTSLLIIFPTSVLAQESWVIESFDSDIAIQQNGKVLVTETIEVDFGEQNKHGIYRDIPHTYQQDDGSKYYTTVDLVKVQQDNAEAEVSTERNSSNIRFRVGDADKIITGSHTYELTYEVVGVLRPFDNYDELYWNVTSNGWDVPIEKATATVRLPKVGVVQVACYQGASSSRETCTVAQEETVPHFVASRPLAIGEGLTIATGYTKGMVPLLTVDRPPTPEAMLSDPLTWVAFFFIVIPALVFIVRHWLQKGRDQWFQRKNLHDPNAVENTMPFLAHETVVATYEAPEKLRPAEIGVLVDERADTLDVSASIVDLASRGHLTITEEPKKWFLGETDYTLKRTGEDTKSLLDYEQYLFEALFETGTEVRLSELKNKFYMKLGEVKEKLYEEVTRKKLFSANPNTVRTQYGGIGIVTILLGGILTFSGFTTVIPILFGLGLALFVSGLALTGFAFAMPARTAYGRELYRRAKGFELFINTAEKYRAQFAEKENLFNEILPYAIVFGATKKLADAMAQLGITPQAPYWYAGTHPFNPTVFAADLNGFSHTLSSAIASSPSGSGSGGGGSSGGGFGGGGGGSW